MKAAHRKELHTNALASQMGRLVESVKAGPKSTSAVVWIFVVVALGTFAVWKYYSSTAPVAESARWLGLADATHDPVGMAKDLQDIVQRDKGTMQARIARFQLARLLVREGQEMLGSDTPLSKDEINALKQSYGENTLAYDTLHTRHDQAVEMLRSARKTYEAMLREARAFPLLYQEALMGAAKTEEALTGTVDEAGTPQGSLDKALGYYRELVQLNLKQLGTSAPPDQAVATLENLVSEKLRELGQEYDPNTALQTYQRLAEVYPDKFKGPAGAWRDLSYPGRSAAQRARELQQDPQKVKDFYADLSRLVAPKKLEAPKADTEPKGDLEPKKEPPKPEEPKKAEEPKKTEAPKPAEVKKDEPQKADAPKPPDVPKPAEPTKGSDAKGK
jgi:hypothetical protein